tara:strand:- start:1163 stop:1408 length:246 start_codon:yes stop_codon:yes gene_type:complete
MNEFTDKLNEITNNADKIKSQAKAKAAAVKPVIAKQTRETQNLTPMDLATNEERKQPDYKGLHYDISVHPRRNKSRPENKY